MDLRIQLQLNRIVIVSQISITPSSMIPKEDSQSFRLPQFKRSPRQPNKPMNNLKYSFDNLSQILQLTQENETCRIETPLTKSSQNEQEKHCVKKYLLCFHRLFLNLWNREKLAEVDVNQSQMSNLIERLRSRKDGYVVVLPPLKDNRKTLILDLDQTLVHTLMKKVDYYDFETEICINGKTTTTYTIKRFGLDAFLFEMSKIFEIIVFTAGQKKYADAILDRIDPKGWITHRLYRQHCILVNKTYHLKNLKILGRCMSNCVMVDDNRMGGVLQPDNYYRIEPFTGNPKDRKLVRLAAFLKYLNTLADMRPVSSYRKKFDQREIKLKENSFTKEKASNNTEQKRRTYRHKKTNSEVQSLAEKDTNLSQNDNEHQSTNTHLVIGPR